MPTGVEVFVDEGFATIGVPDREQRAAVLRSILQHTPAALIEKDSRSGPFVLYRIPVGNAEAAGLIDDETETDVPPIYKKDLQFAQKLVDADPKLPGHSRGHGEWRSIPNTITDQAYMAMPTTTGPVTDADLNFVEPKPSNGKIRAELRPNKNVASSVPQPPAYASETAAELQARIRENTINPADYAPQRVPLNERVPAAQGTIASVVNRTPDGPAEPLTGFGVGPNAGRVVEGSPTGDAGPTVLSSPDIIAEQRQEEESPSTGGGTFTAFSVSDPGESESQGLGSPTADPSVESSQNGESESVEQPMDAGEQVDNLDSLTVSQLRALAVERGVDLGGATKKADIIAKLRTAADQKSE